MMLLTAENLKIFPTSRVLENRRAKFSHRKMMGIIFGIFSFLALFGVLVITPAFVHASKHFLQVAVILGLGLSLVISILAVVVYDLALTELNPVSKTEMNRIAQLIMKHPEIQQVFCKIIEDRDYLLPDELIYFDNWITNLNIENQWLQNKEKLCAQVKKATL